MRNIEEYKIDKTKLTGDYEKNPLGYIRNKSVLRRERPCFNDVEYLYTEVNMSLKDLSEYLKLNYRMVTDLLNEYGIKKDKKQVYQNLKKTMIEENGVENPFQLKSSKEKSRKTNLEKYGVEYYTQTDEYKLKNTTSRKEKYGDDLYQREKYKNSCLKKYGMDNSFKLDKIKDKIKETCRRKYGSKNYSGTNDWKKKCKETCQRKYGVDKFVLSDEYKEKMSNRREEINQKIYQTKIKNHTFNSSKPEKEIERLLKNKYPNIKTQYKSKEYPFNCDFYIPEIDTYIEYQGTWFHGGEPYIGTNEQKEKLKLWETKLNSGHKSYSRAIRIWNEEDVLKRRTAQQNNLNYLEFFNMRQFMDWFNRK